MQPQYTTGYGGGMPQWQPQGQPNPGAQPQPTQQQQQQQQVYASQQMPQHVAYQASGPVGVFPAQQPYQAPLNAAYQSQTPYHVQPAPLPEQQATQAQRPVSTVVPQQSQAQPNPALLNPQQTDENGLRWTWSTYPNTEKSKSAGKSSAAGNIVLPPMIVPLACMYTPLFPMEKCPRIVGAPNLCRNCSASWSNHSRVDVNGQYWVCLSCLTRNPLPQGFDPAHPALHHDTVEYIEGLDSEARPVFIFVVDTCISTEEMDALKRNLARSIDWLPPLSLVGFLSFGHGVTLWELGCEALNKCFCLRGTRRYEQNELSAMLNVTESTPVLGRFLCPLDECEFALNSIMDDLAIDPFPVAVGSRPQRATGTAIDVAVRLLELLNSASTCGKVMLFTGGPCTRGPGTVVGVSKEEMMRFHRDFLDGNVPHYSSAFEFYHHLEQRLMATRSCLDVFAESFDQVGITEMRHCVNHTGGSFICGDSFDHEMFAESFQRFFERSDLKKFGDSASQNDAPALCAFAMQTDIHTSSDTCVSGVLGPCSRTPVASGGSATAATTAARMISPNVIGCGNCTRWLTSSADPATTLTFVFDTETQDPSDPSASTAASSSNSGATRFFQFVTSYVTATGQRRTRVTTVVQPVAPTKDAAYFVFHKTFDQACAAAVTSRTAVWLLEQHDNRWETTRRWLDRLLVSFVKKFGTYEPNQPDSLRLAAGLSLFPSFMFNLRRSEYFMILNISPDETTFKRHWIMREPCDACVLMIQPMLMAYTLSQPEAQPVPLDNSSLVADQILLMDAFFQVHILWGATVFEWRKMKWHENPEYAHFKAQLDAPERDADEILKKRFPYPRFSRTDVNGSESRHVKTRMNPTLTQHNMQHSSGEVIYTDDASISRFMQTLKIAAVAPDTPVT